MYKIIISLYKNFVLEWFFQFTTYISFRVNIFPISCDQTRWSSHHHITKIPPYKKQYISPSQAQHLLAINLHPIHEIQKSYKQNHQCSSNIRNSQILHIRWNVSTKQRWIVTGALTNEASRQSTLGVASLFHSRTTSIQSSRTMRRSSYRGNRLSATKSPAGKRISCSEFRAIRSRLRAALC